MSDEKPQDSGLDTGTGAPPAPSISSNSSAKQGSQASQTSEDALIEKVLSRLAPEIDKRFQSTKDKRFKTVEQLGDFLPTMQTVKGYLDAAGGDVNKAAREMAIDQMISGNGGTGTAPQQEQRFDAEVAKDIVSDFGIDYDTDPDVLKWREGEFPSETAALKALNKIMAGKVKGGQTEQKPASAGAAVFDGGKNTVSEDEQTKLQKEIQKVPFGDSSSLYKLGRDKMPKNGRRG